MLALGRSVAIRGGRPLTRAFSSSVPSALPAGWSGTKVDRMFAEIAADRKAVAAAQLKTEEEIARVAREVEKTSREVEKTTEKTSREVRRVSGAVETLLGFTANAALAIEDAVTSCVEEYLKSTEPCPDTLTFNRVPGTKATNFGVWAPDGTSLTDFDGVVIPVTDRGEERQVVAIVEAKHAVTLDGITRKVQKWIQFEDMLQMMRNGDLTPRDFVTLQGRKSAEFWLPRASFTIKYFVGGENFPAEVAEQVKALRSGIFVARPSGDRYVIE